jgi:hypothetical protein
MDSEREGATDRWLAADQAGRELEAEAEFSAVVRGRARLAPSATLEARIWQATRWVRLRRRAIVLGRRMAVGVGTLAALTAGLYFGVTLLLPFAGQTLVRLVSWMVRGFVWVTLAFTEGLDTWSLLAQLGRALADAIATPEATIALIAIQLIGVLAFHVLNRVLAREKEISQ